MKALLGALFLLIAMNSHAYFCHNTGYFTVTAQCTVGPATAQCMVQNHCHRPMNCFLSGSAQSRSGVWGQASISGIVYPGSFMNIYLNANNPVYDPLYSAHAQANCYF